jgi:zinc transport system substrate-binding protein
VIAEHLAELDPENAAVYAANAAAGQAELAALEEELSAQLAGIKGKPFVVFHDAYQPFEARFGVSAVASVSPSDAQKPGAGRISQVQEVVQDTGAVCGFAEPQMNPALLGVVMEGQADFTIATLDPLGVDLPLGADLYPGLLRGLADAMVGCLGAE